MGQRSDAASTGPSPGESVASKLLRIAEKARNEPKFRFTSLFHLMNTELLRECFQRLKKNKAAGVDEVTKEMYAADLETNLIKLVDRLQRMAYIPQPVRRVFIPKTGSDKLRPLGIPTLEDKLVQAGLVRILEAIYEQDFIDGSYGFRRGRGQHDALRALSYAVEKEPVNYIVEADIKGFFDTVRHDWILKFLEHRVGDRRVWRMVWRFLRAGVVEDGAFRVTEEGTPQGGVISPLLANIYLHYVLDIWFERVYRKRCTGYANLVRFADDFVTCFRNEQDATEFRTALIERLAKFGLAVEPTKTKMLEFGRFAIERVAKKGKKPETFDFLGLTHYCDTRRTGKGFRMKRITARKKFRAKLREFKEWVKKARTSSLKEIWQTASAKLRGHFNYYGVTDNFAGIKRFAREAQRLLFKWLNRRSQRNNLPWDRFNKLLERHPLPTPRIFVNLLCDAPARRAVCGKSARTVL